MGIEEGDAVIAVELSDGKEQIFLGTRDGMAIRFDETDVRPMGRSAYGVRGISLRDDDEVVAMDVVREGGTLLTVAQNGYGKRTGLEEYRLQSRGGVGIINIQTTDRNGKVVGIAYVHDDDQLMLISQQGMILRMKAGGIRTIGRATQGVRLIEMEEGDMVVSVAKLAEREDERRANRRGSQRSRCYEAGSGRLELGEFRQQLLLTRPSWKRTVILRSSLCSSTDSTVPMPNCACRTRMPGRRSRRRLILVLVRVARRLFPNARAASLAAVRVGPELVVRVREAALVAARCRRRLDALDELGRDLVEEA